MDKFGLIKTTVTSVMMTSIVVAPTIVHFTTKPTPIHDPTFTKYVKQALEEFGGSEFYSYSGNVEGICAQPRKSGNFNNIVPYLEQRVKEILGSDLDGEVQRITGTTTAGEENCDLMFDVKPTKGCESWKPIILQGHMDMVLDGTKAAQEYAEKYGIQPEIEGNIVHSVNHDTSLGADNGMGLSILLTLLKNRNSFKHGPIRILCTSNEETTTGGAEIIKEIEENKQKVFFPDGKAIDYLINVDAEPRYGIYRSCAGLFDIHFNHEFSVEEIGTGWIPYELWIGNLNGGHSAWDMENYRANADRMAFEFLNELNGTSGQNIKIISYDHNGSEFKSNQIIKNGHLIFAINSNISEQTLNNTKDKLFAEWSEFYTGDDFSKVQFSFAPVHSSSKCLSSSDTANLIKFLGSNKKASLDPLDLQKGLFYGILDMTDDESPRPVASTNIGPIKIDSDSTHVYLTGVSKTRLIDEENIDKISQAYQSGGNETLGYQPIINNIMIPWMPIEDNTMLEWMEDAYRKIGVKPNPIDTRGGVEPAHWIICNPNLKCICVGPEIQNAHSTAETCSIDTIDPCIKALMNVLSRMGTL
ncbi:MAG: M20/M25/M40 family metallo-hydrolase [Mycoplasmoidaceae bacterium]